jgi:uncharacterized coiled-coil protein SlyX
MFRRAASLFAVALLFAVGSARAQQASVYDKSQDDRLTALEKKIKDVESGLANQKSDLEKKIDDLTKLVAAQTRNVGTLTDTAADQKGQIQKLSTDVDSLTSRINTELGNIQKNLADISRNDGGQYVPNISAAMEHESFRQDLGTAVNRSLKTRGTFRIANKTPTHQWIAVNRTEYVVRPSEELLLDAPVGTVTTQLPGQELMNWTLAAPGYYESIDIVPAVPTRTTAERPVYGVPPSAAPASYLGASDYLWTSGRVITYP